jgi:Ser/Thr protein kinase RdoA (MazF antagonist)
MEQTGAALARVHASGASVAGRLDARSIELLAAESRDAVATILPAFHDDAAALMKRIVAKLPPEYAPVFLHGDFSNDQVVFTRGGARLIDFDNASMGPAQLDLGNFWAKAWMESPATALERFEALSRGYERESGRSVRRGVAPFAALALLRGATAAFRLRRPDWDDKLRVTLSYATEVLDDG